MVLIIDAGSQKTPLISKMVNELHQKNKVVALSDLKNDDFLDAKAVVISGSPTLLTQEKHQPFLEKILPIKDGKLPTLGICFGHQLLGLLFGSQIFRGAEVRTPTKIRIEQEHPLWEGFDKEVLFSEDHTEGISLPRSFELLASSPLYKVEAMVHRTLPLAGVQFHPETSGENGKMLFRNFFKWIKL